MNYNRCHAADKIARETFRKYHRVYPEHITKPEMFSPSFNAVLGTYRKTRVFCSSPFCCGNPRYSKSVRSKCLTRQELKADIDFKEQIEEMNGD